MLTRLLTKWQTQAYIQSRNYMVRTYQRMVEYERDGEGYLTGTECRRKLAGDACSILRWVTFVNDKREQTAGYIRCGAYVQQCYEDEKWKCGDPKFVALNFIGLWNQARSNIMLTCEHTSNFDCCLVILLLLLFFIFVHVQPMFASCCRRCYPGVEVEIRKRRMFCCRCYLYFPPLPLSQSQTLWIFVKCSNRSFFHRNESFSKFLLWWLGVDYRWGMRPDVGVGEQRRMLPEQISEVAVVL